MDLRQQEQNAYTVSKFAEITNKALKGFGMALICGEISQLKRSNNLYFTIKDDKASLDCILFQSNFRNLSFTPEIGQKVLIAAEASLNARRGNFAVLVKYMDLTGIGHIMAQLEQLERRLRYEGVIPRRPLPVPTFFRKVIVVTSASGLVQFDISNNVLRRYPALHLHFIDTKVQGADAPASIVNSLYQAYNLAIAEHYDAVILARGGGSTEDLLCFSDEQVVRMVARSPVFIISAIGHDKDHPLCDLAADKRVSTPTAAAEFVTPITLDDLNQRLNFLVNHATDVVLQRYDEVQQDLSRLCNQLLSNRTFNSFISQLNSHQQQVHLASERLFFLMQDKLNALNQSYKLSAQALEKFNLEDKLSNLSKEIDNKAIQLKSATNQAIESRLNQLTQRFELAKQSLLKTDAQSDVERMLKDLNHQIFKMSSSMELKISKALQELIKTESKLNNVDLKGRLEALEQRFTACQKVLDGVPQRLDSFNHRLHQVFVKLDCTPEQAQAQQLQPLPRNFDELTKYSDFAINQYISQLEDLFESKIRKPLDKVKLRYLKITSKLSLRNPVEQLQQGLSLTTTDGKTILDDASISEGQELITLTKRSKIHSVVTKVEAFDPAQEFGQYLSTEDRKLLHDVKDDLFTLDEFPETRLKPSFSPLKSSFSPLMAAAKGISTKKTVIEVDTRRVESKDNVELPADQSVDKSVEQDEEQSVAHNVKHTEALSLNMADEHESTVSLDSADELLAVNTGEKSGASNNAEAAIASELNANSNTEVNVDSNTESLSEVFDNVVSEDATSVASETSSQAEKSDKPNAALNSNASALNLAAKTVKPLVIRKKSKSKKKRR